MAGVYFGSFLPTRGVGGEGACRQQEVRGDPAGQTLRGRCGRERGPRGAGRGIPSPRGDPAVPGRLKVTAKSQRLATLSAAP